MYNKKTSIGYALLLAFALLISSFQFTFAQKKKGNKTPEPVVTENNAAPVKIEKKYTYESVPNDPLNARIYKLENGLTVYMTVYKNAPRVQTYVAVKAGSKNDPSNATGLAHYLEHMLFKGTDKFGTLDYAKEKVLIEEIKQLYEGYRKTTNEAERKAIYRKIDSVSGIAATYAIANEYDKMMAAMGVKGTNAYTWLEQTVYVNDVPSNQIEKWLEVESERFRNPVLRLFHTELEAVYEEKNISLDEDGSKAWEALFAGLWPKHTYGSQTTIGTVEHLKNPSLVEIEKFYNSYYTPNNMAICLSGDFDPDVVIKQIDEKFGLWQSKPVPEYVPVKEDPITEPIVKEVVGPEAESIYLAFRFNSTSKSKEADLITLVNYILFNQKAGLIDLNLNQKQKVLSASAFPLLLKDYSAHVFGGEAKEGQKLEEVKDLILAEIEKVKKGDFPDWLISAVVNDMKLQRTSDLEKNVNRADAFVNAFVDNIEWESVVNEIDRISKITKQEVMDFVKENYKNNYVVVYKRTGEDNKVQKIAKPEITPVEVNRDAQSPFLKKILETPVNEVQPVFIDYSKDIQTLNLKNNIPLYYNHNRENTLFNLYYVFDMGQNNNKKLPLAIDYLEFLGTSKYTPAQIKEEFYKLGCSYSVFSSDDQVYVSLSGLSDNFEKALALFEEFLSDVKPNKEALKDLVADVLKRRADNKLNKSIILWNGLYPYGVYGSKSPETNILSEAELKALKPEELVSIAKGLSAYEHRVLYYGPFGIKELSGIINNAHKVPAQLKPVPKPVEFVEQESGGVVYVVDYDMKQAEIIMLSKGDKYNKENAPFVSLFNEYFGGGMSSVVFQEIRESKALAYSVFSSFSTPDKKEKSNYVFAYVGTQADKLPEAMASMTNLMNNMPESENLFNASKEALIQNMRSRRITKTAVLFNYESAKKLGLDYDIRKDVFQKVPTITMADLKAFHEKNIKDKKYTILVLGKKSELDIATLEKYGKIQYLKLEDIFGY